MSSQGSDTEARGYVDLHDAVERDEPALVARSLARGAHVHTLNREGWSALHVAVIRDHIGVAQALLDAGTNPNLRSQSRDRGDAAEGMTPLHLARSSEMVTLLISCGAEPDARTDAGDPPLFIAIHDEHLGVAATLLEAGADPTLRNEHGEGLLEMFGRSEDELEDQAREDLELARLLARLRASDTSMAPQPEMETGFSPDHPDWPFLSGVTEEDLEAATLDAAMFDRRLLQGGTPLLVALSNAVGQEGGWTATARRLLDHGVDVHARTWLGTTALHLAARWCPSLVGRLLEAGVDPNARDDFGDTPLSGAVSPAVITALVAAGADIDAADHFGTPAWVGCLDAWGFSDPEQAQEFYAAIQSAGATPWTGISAADGRNAIHVGATSGVVEVMAQAHELGVGIEAQSFSGKTPLDEAIMARQRAAIAWLVRRGASTTSAMSKAIEYEAWHGVLALLDAGASDPEVELPARLVPLAAETGWLGGLPRLVRMGLDPNARDSGRKTALHWLVRRNALDVAEPILTALLDAGADPTVTDGLRQSLLHIAAKAGRADWVPRLLELGVPREAKSTAGTALDVARERNHGPVIAALVGPS